MHIKLRLSSRSSRIEQQLRGVGVFFAPMHPAPCREAALDRCEGQPQTVEAANTARQVQGVFLDGLRGLGQAAVWIGPTTHQEHPVLHQHGQECGIHLTQDTPGLGPAGLVHVPMALPQCKEACDLPPHAPEDESLPPRQALRGHMGHDHGPGRP